MTKEQETFSAACQAVLSGERRRRGIGTLGEKTLHAVLKQYFEPREENWEIKVGPYVADILGERGIVEIQTGSMVKLRGKLDLFLADYPVTVVYPVPARKWLGWIEKGGAVSPLRKSPKQAGPWEILPELYWIRGLLSRPGLSFCALLLEMEEYRLKNGWSEDGKRGSTRFERMPTALLGEVWIRKLEDYGALIPLRLSELFTVKEFSKAAKLSPKKAAQALRVLRDVGAVQLQGKRGRAYLYSRS